MAKEVDWRVPVYVRVKASSAPIARAKAIGALASGARVPHRWLTVGEPERAD